MIRCVLLDDELPGLAYLRSLCEQIDNVEVIKAFTDPAKLLKELTDLDFDLCILDIEMPGISGLEVANILQDKLIIFTTAYKEYAAEAFDMEAIDYIRKPIQKERLEKALQKAHSLLEQQREAHAFIPINSNKGKTILYFDQLLYITVADTDRRDKQAFLQNDNEIVLKNISFEELMDALPPLKFMRINRRTIVAKRIVAAYTSDSISTNITDANGKALQFSLNEHYRKSFLEKYRS